MSEANVLLQLGHDEGSLQSAGEVLLSKLLAHPAVHDAHILATDNQASAWVVPRTQVSKEALVRDLTGEIGSPPNVLLIDRLPLDEDGCVDTIALEAVARSRDATDPIPPPIGRLHVRDLLGDTRIRKPSDRPAGDSAVRKFDDALPKAYTAGDTLEFPPDAPRTLTQAMMRLVDSDLPEKQLTFVERDDETESVSYAELYREARRVQSGLYSQGIRSGDRVILQIESLREFFSVFWGCVLGGIAPVSVAVAPSYDEPGAVVGKLWNVWQLLKRPHVICSASLKVPLSAVHKLFVADTASEPIPVIDVPSLSDSDVCSEVYASKPEDTLFYQLTSGSTGVPKCITITHGGVVQHVNGVARHNGYCSDDISLSWLPTDHVMSVLTSHLRDTYLGASQIHVATELLLADPLRWFELIQRYRVSQTYAPNFMFKLINQALADNPDRRWDLSTVKYFLNGGEQVTLPVISEFLERTAPFGVPTRAMQPAFGMAESCTGIAYTRDFTPDRGVHRIRKDSLDGILEMTDAGNRTSVTFTDLGPAIPGVEIRIADEHGTVLPECVIGRLQLRGPAVTPGYLFNDEANREAFVGDGWFNTGDLGFLKDGRLAVTGREKEMLVVRGANFYCYEIEDVVNNIAGVQPTCSAACAVVDDRSGEEGFALFFVPETPGVDTTLIQTISETVTRHFGIRPYHVLPVVESQFPKTTSGKIQRSALSRRFVEGEFAELTTQVDRALGNENTIPDWFFHRTWHPRQIEARRPLTGTTLAFVSKAQRLDELGPNSVRVEIGGRFAQVDDNCYRIDPQQPEDYRWLLQAITQSGRCVSQIVHCWAAHRQQQHFDTVSFLRAQSLGVTSVLQLAKSLSDSQGLERPIRLVVVSADLAESSEHGALRGLINSIPQEWPNFDCRLVEFPSPVTGDMVLDELTAADGEANVAYRNGNRFVARLEKSRFDENESSPFSTGQTILITGGLGGLGQHVCRYLLSQYDARLLIVGRTELDRDSSRYESFQQLKWLGDVLYSAVDVADADGLKDAMLQAECHFGSGFDGAIHLAGSCPTRWLNDETPHAMLDVLRPKVAGARTLGEVLDDKAFLIIASSLAGTFGVAGAAAYAAANSFVDAFCEQQRRLGRKFSSAAFSVWDDTGLSRGVSDQGHYRQRGYLTIKPKQGVVSMLAASLSSQPLTLIGLDPTNVNVSRFLSGPCRRLHKQFAEAACGKSVNDDSANVTPPRSEAEKMVAKIWQAVLNLDTSNLDIDKTFFALGGQSIHVPRVVAQIKKQTQRTMSVVELFRFPTIRALASELDRGAAQSAGDEEPFRAVNERAERQRAARQKSKRRRR